MHFLAGAYTPEQHIVWKTRGLVNAAAGGRVTLEEGLRGVETGAQELRPVQVRRAVSQLTVALSQSRSSEAVTPRTHRNPQQHACTRRTGLEKSVTTETLRAREVSTQTLIKVAVIPNKTVINIQKLTYL